MFEINERAALPELLLEFLATDNLTWLPKQACEYLQGLALEAYPDPVLPQLARAVVVFEWAEHDPARDFELWLTTHEHGCASIADI
jgi:hypothetical protein